MAKGVQNLSRREINEKSSHARLYVVRSGRLNFLYCREIRKVLPCIEIRKTIVGLVQAVAMAKCAQQISRTYSGTGQRTPTYISDEICMETRNSGVVILKLVYVQ